MKYDFLQEDFSAGELSPAAQGHVNSDAYKAGLKLAANMAATRTGSCASRAGGHWLADGFNAHSAALDNSPVQHVDVHDSPFGDFAIEISQHTMRFMDRFGVKDWNLYQHAPLLAFNTQDGQNAWADPVTQTVYLTTDGVTLHNYNLTGSGKVPTNLVAAGLTGFPAGTNEHWKLSGKIAGNDCILQVLDDTQAVIATVTLLARVATFSFDFVPTIVAGVADVFALRFRTIAGAGPLTTSLWDLKLQKNGTTTALDLLGFAPTGGPLVGKPLSNEEMGVDRIRAASFWTSDDVPYVGNKATFWVMFAGGPRNQWAGWCLRWTDSGIGGVWTFMEVPCDPANRALIYGSNAVAVYQDRVFFGNNVAVGRPQLIASRVGFMQAFDGALPQNPAGGARGTELAWFVFKVVQETYVWTGAEPRVNVINAANPGGGFLGDLAKVFFHLPAYEPLVSPAELAALTAGAIRKDALPAPQLSVTVNGLPMKVTPAPFELETIGLPSSPIIDNLVAPRYTPGHEVWAVGPDTTLQSPGDTGSAFGGVIYFNDMPNGGPPTQEVYPRAGAIITISTIPLAEDPLNLTLASPTGNVSWLNVLRGLMLGTTHNEKLFDQSIPLVIDPATGQDFQTNYESNQGADTALPALDVNDKVLFAQKGRQILRLANISITTSGGLIADDVGVNGEHLTEARVRTMCFLKSPVQRVVLGFDDGSGAVMTLVGKNVAWSRLTLPATFGGIYSTCALDTDRGSELFVGTENGVTLHWTSFESKIVPKRMVFPQAAALQSAPPPIKILFDNENPLPPVADGWARCGLRNDTGLQVVGLSASLIGQDAYVYLNGQLIGPIPVTDFDGNGTGVLTFDGFIPDSDLPNNTWVDASGAVRPQELYVGLAYPEHRMTTLAMEGGNPTGTSQSRKSRKVQLYVRFVDSYMPLVNGERPEDRGDGQAMDLLGSRVTDDVACTEMEFQRAAVVDIEMDLPLRFEVTALFGGTMVNNL